MIRLPPEHRTAAPEDSCRLLWQSLPHDDLAVEGAATSREAFESLA